MSIVSCLNKLCCIDIYNACMEGRILKLRVGGGSYIGVHSKGLNAFQVSLKKKKEIECLQVKMGLLLIIHQDLSL